MFHCRKVVDDWDGRRHKITPGALHLTTDIPTKRILGCHHPVETVEFSQIRLSELSEDQKVSLPEIEIVPAAFK